jgi:putative ABC transport system permease protein
VRLLMAKLADRSHELGVLRAFGAERRSLVFQLLLEAGLLGLLAGVLGVLLGLAMMPVAMGAVSLPEPIPVLRAIDALRAIGLSTAGALLAAVYPALRLCRGTPSMQLRGL